jgi:hypothetical protein
MSNVRRGWRAATGVGASALAASVLTLLAPSAAHAAGPVANATVKVSAPTNGKVAAGLEKQVVQLTVSGTGAPALSEDNVGSITLGDCTGIDSYVVTSATTISVKTPSGGCTATTGAGDPVSIVLASGDDITNATGITFVPPPAIDTAANKSVITENSVNLPSAQKIQRFIANGGQYVRVVADPAYAFDPKTAAGLAVTFGGKAGSEVKVYADATSTTPLAATASGSVGNSMTFKTGSGMTASANPTLTITQNGVSASFLNTATGATIVPAPTITSLSVTQGKAKGTTQVVINGSNFSKTTGDYGTAYNVNFCGVPVASYGTPPVNTAGTAITVNTPDVTNLPAGLGTGVYAGPCAVTITDGTNPSPISNSAIFTFVKE